MNCIVPQTRKATLADSVFELSPIVGNHVRAIFLALLFQTACNIYLMSASKRRQFISSNSRQYYIMLPSIPQNDADLITSRDEPPIRTQTCNPV